MSVKSAALIALLLVAGCPDRSRREAEQAITGMSEFADAMCRCTDKVCADKVQEGMTSWATEMSKGPNDKTRPTDEQMKRMTDAGQKYGECMTRAMDPPKLPGPDEPIIGAEKGAGILECEEYRKAVLKLSVCDKIPEATRKLVTDAFEQAAAAWADLPPRAMEAAAAACKAAADATRQATASVCP